MACKWHGLIIDDYNAVMPLPWRKKYGILYCYSPAFIQQLGLFGNTTAVPLHEIISAITTFSKYGDLFLNYGNAFMLPNIKAIPKTNFIINLKEGYEAISNRYAKSLIIKLKKSSGNDFIYAESSHVKEAVQLYRSYIANRMPHVTQQDYEHFTALCQTLQQQNDCFIRAINNKEGILLAMSLFLKDAHRIYNMLPVTTHEGRKLNAQHFLIDSVIKEFAGQPVLFDFEGSDLPGVKTFYENFLPQNQPYYLWHYNRLPFPLRLIKR